MKRNPGDTVFEVVEPTPQLASELWSILAQDSGRWRASEELGSQLETLALGQSERLGEKVGALHETNMRCAFEHVEEPGRQ